MRIKVTCALSALLFVSVADAQTYPANRPIRIIVPLAPGGGSDITARMIAPRLSERLGQSVVVDNRPGANGIAGTEMAARASPDGHTLLLAINTHVSVPWLYQKPPFDALKDFAPVTLLVRSPLVVTVNTNLPVTTFKDFLAYARANPGKVNFGSSGTASPPHLAGELLKSMAKIDMTHVIYKGISPAVTALLANEIQVTFPNVFLAQPQVRSGRLRALAISSLSRSEAAPDWPTISESGLPGYEASIWYGLLAPSGTPGAVVERLQKEIGEIIRLPEVKQQILAQGGDAVGNTSKEFAQLMQKDYESLGKLIKSSGIKLE